MCLTTEVLSNSVSLWFLELGEWRAVVPDHGAENTVGLILYLVSHKPEILTQVCLPLMPHLGSADRISSLGGHPLWMARSVEWFDSAVSDLKPWKCWSLLPCIRDYSDQSLPHGWICCEALEFPGVASALLSHANLIAFQWCGKQTWVSVFGRWVFHVLHTSQSPANC